MRSRGKRVALFEFITTDFNDFKSLGSENLKGQSHYVFLVLDMVGVIFLCINKCPEKNKTNSQFICLTSTIVVMENDEMRCEFITMNMASVVYSGQLSDCVLRSLESKTSHSLLTVCCLFTLLC